MKCDIDTILKYLSCYSRTEYQLLGIELASQIEHLSALIIPIGRKDAWENCAKVLSQKKDAQLLFYLPKLFEWLKDMNWPGSNVIFDRLLHFKDDSILFEYEHSLTIAMQTGDSAWVSELKYFYYEWKGRVTQGDT